jgi:isoamylase
LRDVAWFDERGNALSADAWQNPEARALAVQRAAVRDDGTTDCVLICVNAGHEQIEFAFPQSDMQWHLLLDSAADESSVRTIDEPVLQVQGHSLVLLANRVP